MLDECRVFLGEQILEIFCVGIFPEMGMNGLGVGIPPPPRISGIIELGGNFEKIYGAQSLTGKILVLKNLSWASGFGLSASGRPRYPPSGLRPHHDC